MRHALYSLLTWLAEAVKPTAFGAVPRSSVWPKVRDAYLKRFPQCDFCGADGETVHHVLPVGVDPTKELDPANFQTVCHDCHLRFAHAGSFAFYNPRCVDLAKVTRGIFRTMRLGRLRIEPMERP